MRIQKISVLTLVAVAAGLSLTACDKGGDSAAATTSSSSAASDSGQGGSINSDSADNSTNTANGTTLAGSSRSDSGSGTAASSQSGSGATSGSGTSAGSACRTANLSFTTSHGMGEGELIVNMKNTGAAACTMHGFPGVDLKGRDGTVSADRSSVNAPDVTVAPGQETRFTLYYPSNQTGGTGVTFTSLIVTPPNETHSHTIPQSINIPADSNSAPAVKVDPVGVGK